jgi:hypothetical protein
LHRLWADQRLDVVLQIALVSSQSRQQGGGGKSERIRA